MHIQHRVERGEGGRTLPIFWCILDSDKKNTPPYRKIIPAWLEVEIPYEAFIKNLKGKCDVLYVAFRQYAILLAINKTNLCALFLFLSMFLNCFCSFSPGILKVLKSDSCFFTVKCVFLTVFPNLLTELSDNVSKLFWQCFQTFWQCFLFSCFRTVLSDNVS